MNLAARLQFEPDPEHPGFERPIGKPLSGQAVCVIGGGPGLDMGTARALDETDPIMVNNAYILARAPRVVVAFDGRWYGWHGKSCMAGGHCMVAAMRPKVRPPTPGVHVLRKNPNDVYLPEPSALSGRNSGHGAITLAMNLGATTIYLAGFDMNFGTGGRTHWHNGHRTPSVQSNYTQRFLPMLEILAKVAKDYGIAISAITPTAARIPTTSFSDAMDHMHDNASKKDCVDHPKA